MIDLLFPKPFRRYIFLMWTGFLGFMVIFSTLFVLAAYGYLGPLPSLEELENPKSDLASEVISVDGVVLGKYYHENRSNEQFSSLSPNLVNALIATEDIRFYDHSGIDFKGLVTGFFYNLVGKKRGASTITQQLAKNLFPRNKFNNLFNKTTTKLREWVIATRLEQRYTKEEIITLYFNTVQFSGNAYGVKSAAKVFFDKLPRDLSIEEAAMLVGMLKGISQFNPQRNPERALNRRNTVLGQLYRNGFIDESAYEKLSATPIVLHYSEDDHNDGLATYFREHLRMELMKWAEENGYDLYRSGLKIYTTLDSRMQRVAEESAIEHMSALQQEFNQHWKGKDPGGSDLPKLLEASMKRSDRYIRLKQEKATEVQIQTAFNTKVPMRLFNYNRVSDTVLTPMDSIKYYKKMLQCGFMALDPKTGQIRAWVGGQNYRYFKYDHVNPTARRQVGSTFKPFVYGLAIQDLGMSPCDKVPNEPVVFDDFDHWSPDNADFKNGGELTLYKGLMLSVNNVAAYLMKQLGHGDESRGPKELIQFVSKMGLSPEQLPPVPSICLGVADLSVFEMVGAFATFANGGVWNKPVYLLRIEDKNGNILFENKGQSQVAMADQTAYVMLKMMEKVVNNGTGYEMRGKYQVKGALAGKTGTTQNNSDGWFMGITPNLVVGCWVGCEDRAIHFRSIQLGSGAHMSLPICAKFLKKLQTSPEFEKQFPDYFQAPDGELKIQLDCDNSVEDKPDGGIDFDQTQ